jgi:hypothetical protein
MSASSCPPRIACSLVFAGTLLGIAGCGTSVDVVRKDRDASMTRWENERRRESLLDLLEEMPRNRQTTGEAVAEKKSLVARADELEKSLSTANQELAAVTTQREDLKAKLLELQGAHDRLRDSTEKVKGVASASATELADLRLHRKEIEEKSLRLSQSDAALREEVQRLGAQLREAQAELTRVKAVARSLQDSSAAGAKVSLPVDDASGQNPERTIAGLRGENLALQKRIEALIASSSDGEGAERSRAAAAQGGAQGIASSGSDSGRSNPSQLLGQLGTMLVERCRRAVEGQIAWDSFDFAIAGTAVVFVLGFLWIVIRGARLRRQLRLARREAASARDSGRRAATTAAAEGSEDEAGEPAHGHASSDSSQRLRNTSSIRRSSYPGIISARAAGSNESAPARKVPAEAAEASVTSASTAQPSGVDLLKGLLGEEQAASQGKRTRTGASLESRKVIGARSWNAETKAAPARAAESEEDFTSTQVISGGAGSDDGDFSSTQIIPELRSANDPTPIATRPVREPHAKQAHAPAEPRPAQKPKSPAPAQEPASDLELLSELKGIINQKFDELLK